MAEKKMLSWWVVIWPDSWMEKAHGAFDLGFVIKAKKLDEKSHIHMNASKLATG